MAQIITFVAAALLLAAGQNTGSQALSADTPLTTYANDSFTAPQGWSRTTRGRLIGLDAAEGDLHIGVVEVGPAADANAAAAAAWATYRPDAKLKLQLLASHPARNGWDEQVSVDYETQPSAHLAVYATAFRKGANWTVVLVDGSEGTFEKRSAAVQLVRQSLRPAGYVRESFAGRAPLRLDATRIAQLHDFVAEAMRKLGVPGASIALIDHGRIVYEGGLGVRALGSSDPVDAHTMFMVASNTKGMTTLLLSRLIDEGRLRWDEPVTEAYPPFQLGSAETTRSVLMRHLVCACTGLPRRDYEWIFGTEPDAPASIAFSQLAETLPTSAFGQVFQYNNAMASAAGYVAGHILYPDREMGAAYDAAMQAKIFDPLGMDETTFSTPAALTRNHASPHGEDVDGRPVPLTMDFDTAVTPYRPAAGAWSTAHDMIKYVDLELRDGRLPDGRRLVSSRNLLARRERGVPTGEDSWYGIGLMQDVRWGVPVIHHGGSLAGFMSDIVIVPDAQVGAVILTNSSTGQLLLRPFMRRLLELVYDGKPEAADDVANAAARYAAQVAAERSRLELRPDATVMSALARAYVNPLLGHLYVEGGTISPRFRFTSWSSRIAARRDKDGTVSFETLEPGIPGYNFVANVTNGKRTLTLRDGQHAYVFSEEDLGDVKMLLQGGEASGGKRP